MTCANASATKPFGAIDTPTQGGVASGSSFVNFGWALTPHAVKIIPVNGSTITVLVDGNSIGTVNYNHERPDIESAFPGFQNTAGRTARSGSDVIDTTTMTNGLHTISWTVVDNQGAIEGIGSRFFTVANGAGSLTAAVTAESQAVAREASLILRRRVGFRHRLRPCAPRTSPPRRATMHRCWGAAAGTWKVRGDGMAWAPRDAR